MWVQGLQQAQSAHHTNVNSDQSNNQLAVLVMTLRLPVHSSSSRSRNAARFPQTCTLKSGACPRLTLHTAYLDWSKKKQTHRVHSCLRLAWVGVPWSGSSSRSSSTGVSVRLTYRFSCKRACTQLRLSLCTFSPLTALNSFKSYHEIKHGLRTPIPIGQGHRTLQHLRAESQPQAPRQPLPRSFSACLSWLIHVKRDSDGVDQDLRLLNWPFCNA